MDSADVKRLRELEQENARLKKMVADRDLEIDVMKEIAAKNGERAGSTRAGPVCGIPGSVAAKGVRAAIGGKVDHELHVEDAGEKCASAGCYGVVIGDVSTVRLSAGAHLPGAPGFQDGTWPGLAPVEPGRYASAAQAAQKTCGKQQAACVCADRTRSGLGI
jgi:putative transposase